MQDFLASFRTRRLLCQTLIDLSGQQAEKIASGDYDGLLEVLARKERVLGRVAEGQKAVTAWRQNRDQLAADIRSECEAVLAECQSALEELERRETSATQKLTDRRDATQELIQRVTSGQQTHTEYHPELAAASGPTRLDLTQ